MSTTVFKPGRSYPIAHNNIAPPRVLVLSRDGYVLHTDRGVAHVIKAAKSTDGGTIEIASIQGHFLIADDFRTQSK